MRRHETDWLSLSLGGLFLVVAAVHIGDGDGAGGTDGLKWFIPGVLLVLGVLGLIGAVRGGRTPASAVPAGTPAAPGAGDWAAAQPAPPSDDEPTVRLDREAAAEPDHVAESGPAGEPDQAPDRAVDDVSGAAEGERPQD